MADDLLSITITGLNEWLRAFEGAPRIIEEEMEDAVDTALGAMIAELATYPAPRPNQHYVRTYKLRDGWTNTDRKFTFSRTGVSGVRLANPMDYAEQVQGDNQGPLFAGRWKKASDIEKANAPNVDAKLEAALTRAEERIQKAGDKG